jgi:hypothetical protein
MPYPVYIPCVSQLASFICPLTPTTLTLKVDGVVTAICGTTETIVLDKAFVS